MAETLRLETPKILVEMDPAGLTVDVSDKDSGVVWRMRGPTDMDLLLEEGGRRSWRSLAEFDRKEVWKAPSGDALMVTVPGARLGFKVSLAGERDVRFEVFPFNETPEYHPRDVLWPRHFVMPRDPDSYAVWTLDQGALVFGSDERRFHHPEGYSEQAMSWHGGFQKNAGFVAIAETPDDMYLAMWHDDGTAASTFLHWLPSHSMMRYARKVLYRFAPGLDYRLMAKTYREYARRTGLLVTLKEKVERNPNLRKLIGGCVINAGAAVRNFRDFTFKFTPFDEIGRKVERFRKETGIENASLHLDGWGRFGYDNLHPDTLPPCPDCGGAGGLKQLSDKVKSLGYLFGLHDQYIDNYMDAPSHDPKYFKLREDGRPDKVNNWAGGMCAHNCYTASLYFVKRNIFEGVKENYFRHNSPPVMEVCDPTAYYLDCFTRTVECFHPDHPLTRSENRKLQAEILRTVRTGNHGQTHPIALQIEHVRDFIVPEVDFSYGLGHIIADVEIVGGGHTTEPVGVPVPLWELTFHDCVILPHYADQGLNFLHGQPPWFSVGVAGEKWDGVDPEELALKKRLMALHSEVALEEMTDHRLLEADGSVQRTVFGGGVSVTVDFDNRTVRIDGGRADTGGEVSYALPGR